MANNFAVYGTPDKETADHIYSVSELTHLIKGLLEAEFGRVWVEGEISGFTRAQSGHAYFTLKDEHTQIKAVMFRSRLRGIRFDIESGLKVIAAAQVSVYAPRGEYQLVVDTLEPKGIGALQLAFEQLKARLAAEGLFDEARKKTIPFLPETVGVITSPSGAAIRDIINVMRRRFASVGIVLYPVRVQGVGAAAEIAGGIRKMNAYGKVDVIIVGRGGGSPEDLWAFNEEEVARAIYASKIPVISAVGHEIDFTISDFTADLRAPTPSAAAEMVVQKRVNLAKEMNSLDLRLRSVVDDLISRKLMRLDNLTSRRVLTRPEHFLMVPRQRLDEVRQGLSRVMRHTVVKKKYDIEHNAGRLTRFDPRERLKALWRELPVLKRRLILSMSNSLETKKKKFVLRTSQMEALSPLSVLGRGYSICRTVPEGKIVSDAGQVKTGETINILLRRGALDCRIIRTLREKFIDGRS